jgi:hypothetical protein
MSKRAKGLNVRQVKTERRTGLFADGHGLYLHVRPNQRSWVFRCQINGKRHDMGLGSAELVTLREARDKVLDLHRIIRDGSDPLASVQARRAARAGAVTFGEAAARYIEAHRAEWKDQLAWPKAIRLYCGPIADMPVAQIDQAAMMRVLEPIWHSTTKSAAVLRGRIETVIGFAVAKGYRVQGDNPARSASV